jgi:hypothetical protein
VRRGAFLLFSLLLLASACSGDDGGTDGSAGAGGAFGGSDDCTQLVDQTLAARARVLEQLGDARRSDTERIDVALTSFGGDGPDLAVRYEGLGCGQDFDDAVCASAGDLRGAGPAGRDLVTTWTASCG